MFESSSRPPRTSNSDGSHNLFCAGCGDFVSRTMIRMSSRVLCELCRRIEQGEELTPEVIRAYNASKISSDDSVSLVNVSQYQEKPVKDKFTLRSLGGRLLNALGLPSDPVPELESNKIARQKRRPRIFSQNELASTSIGSMQSLDAELVKKKEQQ